MITRRLSRPFSLFSSSAWTCPECTTRASFLPRARRQQRRALHRVPKLTHDDTFTREGIPGLLSPGGYTIAWTSYQQLMIQKLNALTQDTPEQSMMPKDLVLRFARDPQAANLFNHASMAFNNHHFFSCFSTSPLRIDSVPSLQQSLVNTFGSMETLKATMLDTAGAMFGPGFVWLIWARDLDSPTGAQRRGSWRILTTYLAGTPFPEAGYRAQGIDANTTSRAGYDQYMGQQPVNSIGQFGAFSKSGRDSAKLPPGGTNVLPVLCVNTWEHVWLRDYGMHGKRRYLSDWWNAVDWGAVEQAAPHEAKTTAEFYRA